MPARWNLTIMLAGLCVAPALTFAAESVATAAYPAKPIRFIVPFAPGGSQDVIGRIVGSRLAERLGQHVVIDNRSGAAGLIASELTAFAPPDGYTILMVSAGPITIAPSLNRKLSYDPLRDLVPITQLVETPMALIVSLALPVRTVAELVVLAKAKPGTLNYASTGNGSVSHLTMELFKLRTGTQMAHVPYKGAAPAFIDLLAGQVPLLFTTTASAQPYASTGKARALAVAAMKRSTMMPDVPTLAEAGVKNIVVPVWIGVSTTAGTPQPVIDRLYREFHAVLQQAEVKERMTQLGTDTVGSAPRDFAALLKADVALWAEVIRAARVKIE